MKSVFRYILPAVASAFLLFAGCEIETIVPPGTQRSPANNLVINEVFTLSFSNPSRYNWIEFLNPTQDTVDLTGWTLEYVTYQLRTVVTVAIDNSGNFTLIGFPRTFPTGYGLFRVPFSSTIPPQGPGENAPRIVLPSRGLATFVDNESRLNDVTDWGPGDGAFKFESPLFYGQVDTVETLAVVPDSSVTIRGGWSSYGFLLDTTAQLVLRNPAGEVIDVVRYGNYRYTEGTDPYPGNQSAGLLPPFESLCRYAGAYKSSPSANPPVGNTAADFFVTTQYIRPIPHWYSQLWKE